MVIHAHADKLIFLIFSVHLIEESNLEIWDPLSMENWELDALLFRLGNRCGRIVTTVQQCVGRPRKPVSAQPPNITRH
jgi:hypothetical protein